MVEKNLEFSYNAGLSTIPRLSLNMYPLFLRNNKVLRIVRAAFFTYPPRKFREITCFFRVEIRVGNHILPTLMFFEQSNRLSARKCTRARFDKILFIGGFFASSDNFTENLILSCRSSTPWTSMFIDNFQSREPYSLGYVPK